MYRLKQNVCNEKKTKPSRSSHLFSLYEKTKENCLFDIPNRINQSACDILHLKKREKSKVTKD